VPSHRVKGDLFSWDQAWRAGCGHRKEFDRDRRRIALDLAAAADAAREDNAEEQALRRKYVSSGPKPRGLASLGTLGDALRRLTEKKAAGINGRVPVFPSAPPAVPLCRYCW